MNEIDICKLLNSANTDDLKKRSEITELLIQEGKSAIPTFLYALEHSPWYVRNCVATALEKMGWKPSNDVEKILLLIGRLDIAQNCLKVFEFRSKAVEFLIPLLKDKSELATAEALDILGMICDRRATQPIIELIDEISGQPRSNLMGRAISALNYLVDIGDSEAFKPLIGILQIWDSVDEKFKEYYLSDIVNVLCILGIRTKEVVLIGIHREELQEDVAGGQIECPNCHKTIELPLMAKKLGSTGAYFYYLFDFSCPECGEETYCLGYRMYVVRIA